MRRDKAIKFFKTAKFYADQFSKDPDTKVGCLLLDPETLFIRCQSYNGFCINIQDNPERWKRPTKYFYVCHAESNVIAIAANHGICTKNSIAVVTMFPCVTCCKSLIQAGIKEIITIKPNLKDPKWGEEFSYSQIMLTELAIKIIFLENYEIN